MSNTVEAALLALSARDQDHARLDNGIGFNGRDTGFGNSLAAQVASGRTLSPKQYGTAYRMLKTYRKQLASMGIDYDQITPPAAKETIATQPRTIDFTDDLFKFSFGFDARIKDELKDAIPNRRWDGKNKVWTAPVSSAARVGRFALTFNFKLSDAAMAQIEKVVPSAPQPTLDETWAKSWATDADISDLDINLEKDLLGFQRGDVRFAVDRIEPGKGVYVGDEMGLGKTPVSITVLQAKKAYPALVAMPRVVWLKWADEFDQWTPGLRVVLLTGRIATPNTKKIAERFKATIVKQGQPLPEADIYLVKYSVLDKWVKPKATETEKSKHQKTYHAEGPLKDLKLKALILDEAHYLKEEKAKRTQAALALATTTNPPVRLALSGTPIPNRHRELLPMLKLLGRLEDVAKNEWDFLNFFCNPNGYGVKGTFGFEWDGTPNGDELNRRMRRKFYVQHEKLDRVIDGVPVPGVLKVLPPINNYIPAELEDETRYFAVADMLDEKKQQYSKAMRTLERCNNDEDSKKWKAICKKLENEVGVLSNEARKVVGEEKIAFDIEWVQNWLDSSTGKLIVFGWHREVNEAIAKHFNAPLIYGGTTESQRQDAEDRFNNDPECRLVVGQIQAAGVGWNGTAADEVAFVEFSYVWSDMTQAIGRAYGRIVDVHGVVVNYVYAPGTYDDHVLDDILEMKKKVQKVSVGGA